MFHTHWILIPMSFGPAGIACGILALSPEGVLFTGLLLSLFWIHIAFYVACRIFLALPLNQYPNHELLIALGCFVLGYGIAFLVAYGTTFAVIYRYATFQVFCISTFACGIFFIHDFAFGITLLFGGATLRSMLVRDMPIIRRPHKPQLKIKHWSDD